MTFTKTIIDPDHMNERFCGACQKIGTALETIYPNKI